MGLFNLFNEPIVFFIVNSPRDCSWFASNVLDQNSYIQHRTKMFDMARFISTMCIPILLSLSACDVFKSIITG